MTRRAQDGFTLLELLVVISILALLVVAFVPDLISARANADVVDTGARIQVLVTGIEAFEDRHGFFPPDDLKHPVPEEARKMALKADNGINTGIESLVVFLSQGRGGIDLSGRRGWLTNTDGDDNGARVPLLDTGLRYEVADAWTVPLAYFSATSQGFDRGQRVLLGADQGGEVPVRAWKTAEGGYLGGRKYQIVSAGPDRTFITGDDVTWPER
jgi:prepilin-type N-terminal cleavage/methylation domain-containing protein